MTRIQLNAKNPLMSGFPSDNNCVESGNKDDKDFFNRRLVGVDTFVTELLQRIAYCSEVDLSFCGRMKATVHSADFYARVENLRESHKVGEGTFLGISFASTCTKKGVPKGLFLIPSHYSKLKTMEHILTYFHLFSPILTLFTYFDLSLPISPI